jgi:hypothetical protein
MTDRNSKQDIAIATLSERIKSLEEKFSKFICNDFEHLRNEVKELRNWLFYGFILMIAATIITQIVLKFFK